MVVPPTVLYESLRKRLFFKDFQSSLWPGKKYAPAMPVYMKVSVRDCFLKTFNIRCGRVKICSGHAGLYESLYKHLFLKDFH